MATLEELEELLASLEPDETKRILDAARPDEQWTSRAVKSSRDQKKSGLNAGKADARRRFPDKKQ